MEKNTSIHSLNNQITNRRDFIKSSLFLTTNTWLLVSCVGSNDSLGIPPGSAGKTIAFFGDSLTAGTGGTPYGDFVGRAMPDAAIATFAIGGQTSEQICARQGGIPIKLSVQGGSFSGTRPVNITKISTEFLSTPASHQEYTSKGTLLGVDCTVKRLAQFGSSRVETYTVTPDVPSNVTIPADSVFVPGESIKYEDAIQVLWMGRNNNAKTFVEDAMTDIEASISHIRDPKRYIVLGILTAVNETEGTTLHAVINKLNDQLRAKYGKNFVEMTPPTADELRAISYVSSQKDNSEISNGTFPQGLRSDRVHLNDSGYQVIANRVVAKLNELNY
jgi:lysophospholipase L1-like esterase